MRAYRRLRELGLVTAQVGRGTFVRGGGTPAASAVPDSIAWQRYALPDDEPSYGDRVLAEIHAHVDGRRADPALGRLPVGERIFPVDAIRAATPR